MSWGEFFVEVKHCPNCKSAKIIGGVYCDYHLAKRAELLEEEKNERKGDENDEDKEI